VSQKVSTAPQPAVEPSCGTSCTALPAATTSCLLPFCPCGTSLTRCACWAAGARPHAPSQTCCLPALTYCSGPCHQQLQGQGPGRGAGPVPTPRCRDIISSGAATLPAPQRTFMPNIAVDAIMYSTYLHRTYGISAAFELHALTAGELEDKRAWRRLQHYQLPRTRAAPRFCAPRAGEELRLLPHAKLLLSFLSHMAYMPFVSCC